MNLTDWTDIVRCKRCGGKGAEGVLATLHGEIIDPCKRCGAHPGIDPDVVMKVGMLYGKMFDYAIVVGLGNA